ncbi:hypothetical protein ACFYTQ_31690 [Nocardia sp. NPDC004068]|uniref:hypothetical protein n=1 Tax=Nocardia sp. NPDC004068 TaxID=3364303 RepID=UPI0036B5D0EA
MTRSALWNAPLVRYASGGSIRLPGKDTLVSWPDGGNRFYRGEFWLGLTRSRHRTRPLLLVTGGYDCGAPEFLTLLDGIDASGDHSRWTGLAAVGAWSTAGGRSGTAVGVPSTARSSREAAR